MCIPALNKKILCMYCRKLRVCDGRMTCDECREENAPWIEPRVGEVPSLSATVKVRLGWLLRQ